ncbi:NADP-dependent 3-hydroxy acid dehydrogenase YdfG [Undibacterium sp. GrIS 1.8]|uniref:SDR family oxidoreductase n=1 Tax=unclassified Undibacterium TaxID=2630295 RepID=UPI0033957B65
MSNNIDSKVVVIMGVSSGLGEASAIHLSALGAKVVLGARRVERINTLIDQLARKGGQALALEPHVTQRDQVKQIVEEVAQMYGRIDVIINNVGLMPQPLLENLMIDDWGWTIDVNIKGVCRIRA